MALAADGPQRHIFLTMQLPDLLDICDQPDWEELVLHVAQFEVRREVASVLDSLIEAAEALEQAEAEAKAEANAISEEFLEDIGMLTPPEVVDLTCDDDSISVVVGRKRMFEVVDLTDD